MKIKKFKCGICNDGIARSRKGLRDHLKKHIRNKFANAGYEDKIGYTKQKWWIVEDWEDD